MVSVTPDTQDQFNRINATQDQSDTLVECDISVPGIIGFNGTSIGKIWYKKRVHTVDSTVIYILAIFGHLWPSGHGRPIVASGVSLKRAIKM